MALCEDIKGSSRSSRQGKAKGVNQPTAVRVLEICTLSKCAQEIVFGFGVFGNWGQASPRAPAGSLDIDIDGCRNK